MAKFNKKAQTTNISGHTAYSMPDRDKLVTQILTAFFREPKFYGDNSDDIVALAERVAANDSKFVCNLAVYARKEFNMRSVSHVLAAVIAHETNGKPFIRALIPALAVRADDLTEILSAYIALYGKPIPNSLKKGLSAAFANFDEYALAKYKGANHAVKMRDILRICHPIPKSDEQAALWKRCVNDELQTPYTWETELSEKGNTKEVWESLIASNKVGYMALLRNLRNILNANPDNLDAVLTKLADPDEVRRSRQLPFRFLSAYNEVAGLSSSKIIDTLESAIDASLVNLPKLSGRTAIVVDVSGSMGSPVSAKSKVSCVDIALLLGFGLAQICDDAVLVTFDDKAHSVAVSKRGGVLSQVRQAFRRGGGTNMSAPFRYLIDKKIAVDRIVVLSDNEVNYGKDTVQSEADRYRVKLENPTCFVHAIDLQGYGTQQFIGKYTNIIAGWSEKVLSFIELAEQGTDTLISKIASYDWA